MCEGHACQVQQDEEPFVEAPSPAGAKQTTAKPAGRVEL